MDLPHASDGRHNRGGRVGMQGRAHGIQETLNSSATLLVLFPVPVIPSAADRSAFRTSFQFSCRHQHSHPARFYGVSEGSELKRNFCWCSRKSVTMVVTDCRMYEARYPEVDDVVMVSVSVSF